MRRSGTWATVTGLTAVVVIALVVGLAGVVAGPDDRRDVLAGGGSGSPAGGPAVAGDVGRDLGRALLPVGPPAGRPALVGTHPDENLRAAPQAQVAEDYVSGIVFDEQVLIADAALPWTYWLDPALAEAFDESVIHEAVAVWDDVPGSRWSATYAGPRPPGDSPIADGHSTIFAEASCEDRTTANTYLFTDGGLGVNRYGSTSTQILEADIGICPRVTDAEGLARAIRHEVGHVIGLGHLCDPGDACWLPQMGPGPHSCALMFWQARSCQTTLSDGERLALVRLYPTLGRLAGPTAEQTTTRASFAVTPDGSAPMVVVVADDATPAVAGAAAVLAGRAGGTYLVATPSTTGCLSTDASREANRALQRRGTLVLVGTWAEACARMAYDWDVRLRLVAQQSTPAAVEALAGLQHPVASVEADAVLVPDDASTAEVLPAAAAAVARDVPLFVVSRARTDLRRALLVGGSIDADVRERLALDGIDVVLITGPDPVAVALDVARAEHVRRGEPAGRGVVVAPVDAGIEGLAAVSVAAADDAAVVLSGPMVHEPLVRWLLDVGSRGGWVLGSHDSVPDATAGAYGAAAEDAG
jgi:hypothetical protein